MATDLAIDFNTGDLVISPRNDLSLRTGLTTVEQRIRVRLKIIQGSWDLDPTEGQLGSRVREIFRLPTWRALSELELVIREALQPMEDISVSSVETTLDPDDSRTVNVTIQYSAREEGEADNVDEQTLETTLTIAE